MKKRIICTLLALAMILGLFAACGSGAASAPEAAESAVSAPAESAEAPAEEPAAEAPAEEPEAPIEEASAVEEASALEPETPEEDWPLGYEETPIELPLTDEPMTYTLFTKVPPMVGDGLPGLQDNMVFAELENRTGIHLDITEVSTFSFGENFMLMIAGGDWADLMSTVRSNYAGGLAAALNEEVILDLSEYEEYMPNYNALIHSDPDLYRDVTQEGGAVGAFYRCYSEMNPMDSGLMVRGDWLEELGMEAPETVDEYNDFIRAFHNEYGAVVHMPKNGVMTSQAFLTAWEVAGFFVDAGFFTSLQCFTVQDDKVICGIQEPGFKEYLQMVNQWYDENLISHDYMSVPEAANFVLGDSSSGVSDLLNDKIGLWGDSITTVTNYDNTMSVDPDFRAQPTKVPTMEKGDTVKAGYYLSRIDEAYISVSTTCHDPEIIIQWVDYGYTSEGAELYNWGIEGETYTVAPDGTREYTDLILNNPDYSVEQAKYVYLGAESYLKDMTAYHSTHNDFQMECYDVWNSNFTGEYQVSGWMSTTAEESDLYSQLSSDFVTYLNESVAKFITGEKNFDADYDAFQEDLKTLKVEEMTELWQGVYDRWAGISA